MEQEKLQQMQFLEQNLQSVYMQRQAYQMEISETEAALTEVEKTKDAVYKVIGQLMLKVDKDKTVEDLKSKKKLIEARISALEKQGEQVEKQVKALRDELVASQAKK